MSLLNCRWQKPGRPAEQGPACRARGSSEAPVDLARRADPAPADLGLTQSSARNGRDRPLGIGSPPKKRPEGSATISVKITTWGNASVGAGRRSAPYVQDAICAISTRCPCQTGIDASSRSPDIEPSFLRPDPSEAPFVQRAGPSEGLAGPCSAGRSGPCQSSFTIGQ